MPGPWQEGCWPRSVRRTSVPLLLHLPQSFDLARQVIILAVEMMIDGHHPAVVGVERGAKCVDRAAAATDFGHPVEFGHSFGSSVRLLPLEVEIDAGGDV